MDAVRQEFAEFLEKTDEELMEMQEKENARIESLKNEMIDASRKEKANLESRLEEVGAWSPPNSFCEELKGKCMNALLSWHGNVRKEHDINRIFSPIPILPADEYRAEMTEFFEKDLKLREGIMARTTNLKAYTAEMLKELKASIPSK